MAVVRGHLVHPPRHHPLATDRPIAAGNILDVAGLVTYSVLTDQSVGLRLSCALEDRVVSERLEPEVRSNGVPSDEELFTHVDGR